MLMRIIAVVADAGFTCPTGELRGCDLRGAADMLLPVYANGDLAASNAILRRIIDAECVHLDFEIARLVDCADCFPRDAPRVSLDQAIRRLLARCVELASRRGGDVRRRKSLRHHGRVQLSTTVARTMLPAWNS